MTDSNSPRPKKKVVRVETGADQRLAEKDGPIWEPTPEAKAKSRTFRWIAIALWAVAIAAELFAIFWVLKQDPFTTGMLILLIGILVGIAALSITGSILWKKANRLSPAAKRDKFRFFVQNQLGAIIAIIAFLPLIILIFTNKNMDGKQKGIAGTVGIVLLVVAALFGVDYNPPSQEQYQEEENIVEQLTGENLVFWTKSGSVFHVCETVPDVNRESQDGQIYSGTVAEAHEAGKDRLTKRWESEALNYCGYTQADVDRVNGTLSPAEEDPAQTEGAPAQPGEGPVQPEEAPAE